MWAAIIRWITGDLVGQLTRAYEAKLNAQNNSERVAAEVQIQHLEAKQAIILQAQADRFERWVRIAFAFPFVVYLNKCLLWDKVLGLGSTDPLSDMLTEVFWIVLGGYFLHATAKALRK